MSPTSRTPSSPVQEAKEAAERLLLLIEEADGYGYDHYDVRVGRVHEYVSRRRNTVCGLLARRLLYLCELVHPLFYRRLRGIKPNWCSVGNGHRAGAYLAFCQCDGNEVHLEKARAILDRVRSRAIVTPEGMGFGLGFPTIMGEKRLVWQPDMPNAHSSVRVGRQFLFHEAVTGDGRYVQVVDQTARFLAEGLTWGETDGLMWVGYAPVDPYPVVNIWADVASFLAARDAARGLTSHQDRVVGLVQSVLAHQAEEGWWPYAAHWIGSDPAVDNYHTAMVLGALAHICRFVQCEHQAHIRQSVTTGLEYYLGVFFDEDTGRFRSFPGKEYPIDPGMLGDALCAFNHLEHPAVGLPAELTERMRRVADRSVAWALRHLRTREGRFYTRVLPGRRYALKGVRVWDGRMCDALALYSATRTLPPDRREVLWT